MKGSVLKPDVFGEHQGDTLVLEQFLKLF